VYLCALVAQFSEVIAATYLNADSASAPVIGSLVGHGYGAIVLGNMPWYSTLLFELATRGLPLHRELWEAVPYAMALASVALIADAARRVSGRIAAVVAASVLICASPQQLTLLFSLDDHSPTWFTIALLGWWIVVLQCAQPRSRRGALGMLAAGIAIAVVAGLNAASDNLLLVGGLLPLLLAGAVAFALAPVARSRNAGLAAVAVALLAGLVALETVRVMHDHNVTYTGHFTFAEAARVQSNLSLWWQAFVFLANGNFFGAAIGFTGALAAVCAIVVLAAAVGAMRVGWLQLRALGAAKCSVHVGERGAYLAYWLSAGVALSLAFVLSTAPEGLTASRYLVGVAYAVVALAVLMLERPGLLRAAVLVGALIYCFAGTLAMARGTATENTSHWPSDSIAGQIAALAEREHLVRGYAGYWDAAPITWATHLRVHVFPVDPCGATICQFYLHIVSSWYKPHAGERTFVLVDPTQPFLPALPSGLGKPSASYPIGQLTMYVFPYDVATRIG
jgi:hypothetical protein